METGRERMVAIVREIHERVNRGDASVFGEFLTDEYVRHCQAMPPELQEIHGYRPLEGFVVEHLKAFPDWRDVIDFTLVDADRIAYQTTGTGTQTGPMGPFPATGRPARLVSLIVHRFDGEKIAETWISWDNLAFLGQLGHLPPSGAET